MSQHEHDHGHHDHAMTDQGQALDGIDPQAIKQIAAFLLRGKAGFQRLGELVPDANTNVASMNAGVARKGAEATALCMRVQQDLSIFCQMMSIQPEAVQGFPEEAADMMAGQWASQIMPNMVQQMFAQGLNPVIITVQNPRNMERLFGDIDRDLERVASLLAEAGELAANEVEDDSSDLVDPTLAAVFKAMLRVHSLSMQLLTATNNLAGSDSDDDACQAAEVQFSVMRTGMALSRIGVDLALPSGYVANPPKNLNRFLEAWVTYRRSVADSAFAQGVNREVFLTDGPAIALEQLTALEQTLLANVLPGADEAAAPVVAAIGQASTDSMRSPEEPVAREQPAVAVDEWLA